MSEQPTVPPAPDYGPIMDQMKQISDAAQADSNRAYDWATGQFTQDRSQLAPISSSQASEAGNEYDLGNQANQTYENTTLPALQKYTNDAENYGSEQNQRDQAGLAGENAAQANDAAWNNTKMTLAGYGMKTDAGALADSEAVRNLSKGATVAGAENTAVQATKNQALALEGNAITQGNQTALVGQGAVNTGTSAGSQAASNILGTTSTQASVEGTAPTYMGIASGATTGQANIQNTAYNNEMAAYNANNQQSSGVGALLGLGAGLLLKKGGRVPAVDTSDMDGHGEPTREVDGRDGGYISKNLSPSRGVQTDDIPAHADNGPANIRLNGGEFIMPKDVTDYYGDKTFHAMIDKAHQAMAKRQGVPV